MTIELYTLPNCSICHMVKTKLEQKNIPFIEKNFTEIAEKIHSNRAPALNNFESILNSPKEIVEWINKQE